MKTGPDRSNFPVKMLKALFWAQWHLREARAACVHLLQLGEVPSELRNAIFTGIAVSYARPFGESQGLPRINGKFEKFPSKRAQMLHNGLLEARNFVYAHNDRVTVPKVLSAGTSAPALDRVRIRIAPDSRATWSIFRAGFATCQADAIGGLCDFQIERINEESTRMLQAFSKHQAYEPGDYTLGIDFP